MLPGPVVSQPNVPQHFQMISHTPSRADYEQAYLHNLLQKQNDKVKERKQQPIVYPAKTTSLLTWNQVQQVSENTRKNGDSHRRQREQSQQKIPPLESH